jgi:hypothetical protein
MGAGELRHQQAAAALIAYETAKYGVRDTGHGRKNGSRMDGYRTHVITRGKIENEPFCHVIRQWIFFILTAWWRNACSGCYVQNSSGVRHGSN